MKTQIRLWWDEPHHEGQVAWWCAAIRIDGQDDSSEPLPLEAQADPETYCRQRWPGAEVTIED